MLYIQRVAAISKSEKMSAQRADIASTVLKRVSARGCSIWATGRHPHAILAIPNHISMGRIACPQTLGPGWRWYSPLWNPVDLPRIDLGHRACH